MSTLSDSESGWEVVYLARNCTATKYYEGYPRCQKWIRTFHCLSSPNTTNRYILTKYIKALPSTATECGLLACGGPRCYASATSWSKVWGQTLCFGEYMVFPVGDSTAGGRNLRSIWMTTTAVSRIFCPRCNQYLLPSQRIENHINKGLF